MTETSNNQTGGAQKADLAVLSDSDALGETCYQLFDSGDVDIPTAVTAVYAYASAFNAGIPSMVMPDCSDHGCPMCLLYVQTEVSLPRRLIAVFLADIEYLCQQQEDSANPHARQMARQAQRWVDDCRNVPLPTRYQVLPVPGFIKH